MTESAASTAKIVRTYYELLKGGIATLDHARLRAILAPNLVFEGPIASHVIGAERFIKGVCRFIETVRSLTMLHQLHSADMAATLYDAEMPGGTVRFAEFFHIEDDKIQSLRLLYDPSEYRSRGGH